MTYQYIRYEHVETDIVRILLARPEKRNAQNLGMLYEIDAAFTRAGADESVKVVILAGDGPDFSAGHDTSPGTGINVDMVDVLDKPVVVQSVRGSKPGIEGWMELECDAFLGLSRRWRDFPKPTIAQVQGNVIGGGLMLVWPCDLIVAADNTSFRDPIVAFNVNGHEYFTHVWELGARRAKEFLFTGDAIFADEARRVGMVNHVVSLEELAGFTEDLARRIARNPAFGLRLAKMSVNSSLDSQGQSEALRTAFAYHQLAHAHNLGQTGTLVEPGSLEEVRKRIRQSS